MNQIQEFQQVAQQILMDLTDILPEISASGMTEASDKLTNARNLVKQLTRNADIVSEKIIAGYRTAAQDNLLCLVEQILKIAPEQPVTDEDLNLTYLTAQCFVRNYSEYQVKKVQQERA